MAKFNPQNVSVHLSYTIQELADALEASEKTCFRWIDLGLATVPGSKNPILIKGSAVKEFLRKRKSKHKFTLGRYEFNCLTCKGPRRAKKGSIAVVGSMKKALCSVCSGKMARPIQRSQKEYQIPTTPVQMSMFDNN
ncbi:MAG: hypothetical protein AAB483_03345 [Patescibacteria group bacterium]